MAKRISKKNEGPALPRAFTAVVEKEGDGFVALCPELDVVSQGDSVEEARANLREAVELFLECASPQEIEERLHAEVYVSAFEVASG
jgi:predicted RNase H-like HicB family nuclease